MSSSDILTKCNVANSLRVSERIRFLAQTATTPYK